jgi:outer membrane protein assembly factor BamA
MTAAGDFYPAVLDAISSFGGVQGAVSTYITPGSLQELTFAVRVAGQKVWGIFPVFEAAYLGGITQVRGLRPQRYAGDASAWGNFEARLKLAPLPFVVRWDFGVLAFSDVGRVFLHGTHSEIWHAGVGGGVFALLPDRSALLYLTLAHADNTWALDAGTRFTY